MVKGSRSQQCINKSLVVTQGYLQIIDTFIITRDERTGLGLKF